MHTRSKEDSIRPSLRPPSGNYAHYPRDFLATVRANILKSWTPGGSHSDKREVALTLLGDPELRLRVCHLEEILQARRTAARQQIQANGNAAVANGASGGSPKDGPASSSPPPAPLQLQTALADPGFAALFQLDPSISEPDWGMQVLWLNMSALLRELGIAPPPSPPAPPAAPNGTYTKLATSISSPPPPTAHPHPHAPAAETQLLAALEACFPRHASDDDDYLALAACYCLLTRRDPRSLLPPYSLHAADLAALLAACAAADGRLAAALQRLRAPASTASAGGHSASPRAPHALPARLAEALLSAPRARAVLRQSESPMYGGGWVVSLAAEQLAGAAAALAAHASGRPVLPGVPLAAWEQAAAAASAGGAPVRGASGGGGLPVTLYEYETPADAHARDDMGAAAAATHRDQYPAQHGGAGGSPAPPPHGQPASAAAAAAAAAATAFRSASGGGAPSGSSTGSGAALHRASGHMGLHLQPAASAPAPVGSPGSLPPSPSPASTPTLGGAGPVPPLLRRNTEPVQRHQHQYHQHQYHQGHHPQEQDMGLEFSGAGLGDAAHGRSSLAGSLGGGLGLGGMWGARPDGVSPGSSFSSSVRFPLFSTGHAAANNTDLLMSSSFGGAGHGFPSGMSPPGPGGSPLRAALSGRVSGTMHLSASPAGGGELHVPAEIASVWASAAASTAAGLGQPDGALFAMSPPQESAFLWERFNSQSALPHTQLGPQHAHHAYHHSEQTHGSHLAAAAAAAAGDLSRMGFSLGPFGLGAGGNGPTVDGCFNGLMVGSAPGMLHPYLARGGGGGGGGGAAQGDGTGAPGSTAPPTEYLSWPSSSPDMAGLSAGGRSASIGMGRPAAEVDAAQGNGAWLLAHGTRAVAGCGGGGAGAAGAGRGGAGAAGGPSPSPSDDSEEGGGADALVGGLEGLDMALALEAIIGYEPSPATPQGGPKGLIAAAAAPRDQQMASAKTTFANAVAAANGAGRHASLDAGTEDGAAPPAGLSASAPSAASLLTSWSAMAARAAQAQHQAQQQQQQQQQQQHQQQQQQNHAAATAAAMLAAAAGRSPTSGGGGMGMGMSLLHAGMGQGMSADLAASMAAAMGGGGAAARTSGAGAGGKGLLQHPKLTARVREEIGQLLRTVPGLKPEDFDEGVLHQLSLKRSEEEAVAALRQLGADSTAGIQHMAAYINHVVKNYHAGGGAAPGGQAGGPAGIASLPSATVRANSTPVSSKAILQKLPLRVYRRLEEVIAKCAHMEWKHFDAGVVKVMAQLAEIGEEDVYEELELLRSTDLSAVEYMPAYLNKRLNNRLWSRRKALTGGAAAALG